MLIILKNKRKMITRVFVAAFVAVAQAFQSTHTSRSQSLCVIGTVSQKSSTAHFYRHEEDIMFLSQSQNFAQRMKQRVLKQEQQKQESSKKPRKSNIIVVDTLEEFKEQVAGEKDRMVIVRFFAPWCRACKEMQPSFRRLSNVLISKGYNVKFVEVPITEENANLHQGLGIPAVPFCHIYHPEGGLVEELRFTKKRVRSVARILLCYLQGECSELEMDGETNVYSCPYKGMYH